MNRKETSDGFYESRQLENPSIICGIAFLVNEKSSRWVTFTYEPPYIRDTIEIRELDDNYKVTTTLSNSVRTDQLYK